MPDRSIDIKARLRALQQGYAARLPDKLGEIDHHWKQLATGEWHRDSVELLHRLIHTLAGSAGSFGYSELGLHARAIEQLLKENLEEQSGAPDDVQLAKMQEMLDGLREDVANTLPGEDGPVFTEDRDSQVTETAQHLIYLHEEDVSLAEKLTSQLKHFGYEVRVFHSCEALDAAIGEEQPAAVIADIGMLEGVTAGPKCIRTIQKNKSNPLPVIFLSSRSDLQARLEAIRAGGEGYLTKPVDIDSLVARLEKLLNRSESEPYRILIVDDDVALADRYALLLRGAGMEVTIVNRPLDVLPVLADAVPELILMDVYMPGCSGLEIAKLIRQQDAYLSIPIVFLSSESNLEKQFNALRMGGDDFLTKPIADDHLLSSVAIRAERSRLINSLMVQDSLTGLLKHTKIKEQLEVEVSRARRAKTNFVFAMIDIDHFKTVNDSYGHLNGDRVIKSLSRLLKQRLRRSDSIGRYGGEEFAVILPDCDVVSANLLLDEVRKRFSEIVHEYEDQAFTVTFSAGLASFPQCQTAAELNQAADKALYEAKRQGRNRVVVDGCDSTNTDGGKLKCI